MRRLFSVTTCDALTAVKSPRPWSAVARLTGDTCVISRQPSSGEWCVQKDCLNMFCCEVQIRLRTLNIDRIDNLYTQIHCE